MLVQPNQVASCQRVFGRIRFQPPLRRQQPTACCFVAVSEFTYMNTHVIFVASSSTSVLPVRDKRASRMSRCDLNKRSPRRRKFEYSGICASGIRALAAGFTPCFGARRNIDLLNNTQNLFRTWVEFFFSWKPSSPQLLPLPCNPAQRHVHPQS